MKMFFSSHKSFAFITLAIAVVLAIGVYFTFYSKTSELTVPISSSAQTTSEQPSAQADFTEGTSREPGNSLNEKEGSASISDSGGSGLLEENTQSGISSESGKITLAAPSEDSAVKNGSIVSGSSSLNRVHYRIIDDISGVIATGSMGVVEGKFSGKVSVDTTAKEGRLDIFGLNEDLTEHSNIEIGVLFND
jgi:hypothetical protein